MLAVDLDGTLVDSAPDLAHCVDHALADAGFDPPGEAKTRGWIGDGIERLLERALADATGGAVDSSLLERCLKRFDGCYWRHTFERSRVYPQVPQTLDRLRGLGLHLSCITNKRLDFAERVLEQAGLLDRFELVLGGDSLPAKKPDPAQLLEAAARFGVSARAAMMVGDSHHDRDAARRAGFRFVWARYGYCPSLDGNSDATAGVESTSDAIGAFADICGLIERVSMPGQTGRDNE